MDISPSAEGIEPQVVDATPPEVPILPAQTPIPPFFDLLMQAFDRWFLYWVPVTALLLVPTILGVVSAYIQVPMPYASQVVAIIASLVGYIVGCGVIAIALGYGETRTSVSAAFRASLALAWPLLIIAFFRSLATIGAFGLLILPGIYISIVTMFAQYIAVHDGRRGFVAIAESWRIVSAQLLGICTRMLVFVVLMFVVAMTFGLVADSLGSMAENMVTSALANLVVVPVGLFFSVVLYEATRNVPAFGPSEAMRIKWLKYYALFGVVVLMALAAFVGYALVEYAPNVLQNTMLRFNPPGLAL